MARADRLARMDDQRETLENEYRQALIAALQSTAAGKWGLFDHQKHPPTRAKLAPVVDALIERGDAIDALRDKLGMEPFDLHREFLASRGPVRPDAVGEPKQAQAWLARLGAPAQ